MIVDVGARGSQCAIASGKVAHVAHRAIRVLDLLDIRHVADERIEPGSRDLSRGLRQRTEQAVDEARAPRLRLHASTRTQGNAGCCGQRSRLVQRTAAARSEADRRADADRPWPDRGARSALTVDSRCKAAESFRNDRPLIQQVVGKEAELVRADGNPARSATTSYAPRCRSVPAPGVQKTVGVADILILGTQGTLPSRC